jgi:hypothetical protein
VSALKTRPSESRRVLQPAASSDDGTSQLLKAGFWILAVGGVSALLAETVFGGISRHGPHTNSGWLALITAMMCLPFGSMLALLGAAKWLRKRRMAKAEIAQRDR